MNEQKERMICFDIDQNKQKINHLMKKNKENEENLSKLPQMQTQIDQNATDIVALQTEVNKPKEEKVTLLSYDIYKLVDNTYRDSLWNPQLIYFAAQPNSRVKLHIEFVQKNTFPSTQPRTATTQIFLDDEEIFNKEVAYENGPEETPIDVTHMFTSKTGGHKIELKISNTCPLSTFLTYIKPDFVTIELFGTNVQFVSRNHDFMVAAGPGLNFMTTTCIDEKPRLSLQAADETLTLDKSAFRTGLFNNYRQYNFLTPFFDYDLASDGTVTRYTSPGVLWSNYPNYDSTRRVSYRSQLPEEESTYVSHNYITLANGAYSITIKNDENELVSNLLEIVNDHNVAYNHIYSTIYIIKDETCQFGDCAGLNRLDNFDKNKDIIGFVTKSNCESFMTYYIQGNTNPPRLELGVGSHINAYLRADDSIEAYMRVGKDCKKIIIKKDADTGEYYIASTQLLENVQEYWLGADGTHFERVGNQILYYPQNATSPTQTFDVFF